MRPPFGRSGGTMVPKAGMLLVVLALALAGCATPAPAAPAALYEASTDAPSATPTLRAPMITHRQVTETSPVPFDQVTQESDGYPAGSSQVTTAGVDGVRTVTYDVTYSDGVETARTVVSDVVTTPPVAQVTTLGTHVEAPPVAAKPAAPSGDCDPNYTGACVPIASDVDCAGGSGNGPAYVRGPVTVVGTDIYKLDSDHDGIGCE